MSNDASQAERNDDELNEFERLLRAQSLGGGRRDRGELMYRCGYAAGVAAINPQQRRATVRWRVVGLAASILACLSISAHFFSASVKENGPLGMERPLGSDASQSKAPSARSNSTEWITRVTRDRPSDEPPKGMLRAVGSAFGDADEVGPRPFEFDSQGKALTPRDFPLFL